MSAKEMSGETLKGDASAAREQLNLVLGFFSRIDTKFPIVLGIDLGMLGVLGAKMPSDLYKVPTYLWCVIALFLAALIFSLIQLYRGSFPNVKGGEDSVVFFGHIAGMREQKFIEEFNALSGDKLATELLGQVWRNARILSEKIAALKLAYIAMLVSSAPWTFALAVLATTAAR